MEILKKLRLDGRDIRLIANFNWNQITAVCVDGDVSQVVRILKGVRQVCVLSPLLFNLKSEFIFRKIMENSGISVVVNGVLIKNLKHANDTALKAISL